LRRSRRRGVHPSYAKRGVATPPPSRTPAILTRLTFADRKSLLLGTALASTLLLGSLLSPTRARAVVNDCADPGPDAVSISVSAPVICINSETRNEPAVAYAITITTNGSDNYIYVNNSGSLIANNASGSAYGLLAYTHGEYSFIDIKNSATITVTATPGGEAFGIYAATEFSTAR
jgi:hypothetical protein